MMTTNATAVKFDPNNNIRLSLSQAYRILAQWGVDDHTYTHVSARSAEGNSFFIEAFGHRYAEVTPDKLIKVNLEGDILEGTEHIYNQTGYIIHGAAYQARPDINFIIHIHTPEIVAVSACKQGLMPISQWGLHFYGRVSYHDYGSLALNPEQGQAIARSMGQNYTMLLRHHGSVTSGRTVQEAMFYTYHLQKACETQCLALSMGQELVLPSHEVCQQAVHDLLTFEKNLGERDWQAWVRHVDIHTGAYV